MRPEKPVRGAEFSKIAFFGAPAVGRPGTSDVPHQRARQPITHPEHRHSLKDKDMPIDKLNSTPIAPLRNTAEALPATKPVVRKPISAPLDTYTGTTPAEVAKGSTVAGVSGGLNYSTISKAQLELMFGSSKLSPYGGIEGGSPALSNTISSLGRRSLRIWPRHRQARSRDGLFEISRPERINRSHVRRHGARFDVPKPLRPCAR